MYWYNIIDGSLFLKYTGTLSVTYFDLRPVRSMASIPLCKYSIFIKYFGFSTGTSLLTGLKSLCWAMSRMMAVALYSAEEKSWIVGSSASC